MDYSIPLVIIAPDNNVTPTTGTTATLTPSQVGVFLPTGAPATAGNAAAARYIFLAQGQSNNEISLKSDKIFKDKIIRMTKIVAEDTAANEVWQSSIFSVHCGEHINLSFRMFSNYINTSYANGLTATVWSDAPCCDCDADPCALISAADTQALVDDLVAKFNAPNTKWFQFASAVRFGTGANSRIQIGAKPIVQEGDRCDPRTNPYEYDTVIFQNIWVYKDVDTTQDQQLYGEQDCELVATFAKTQKATFERGSWQQVQQIEKNNISYRRANFNTLYSNPNFNGWFTSEVVVGLYYDEYLIKFYCSDVQTHASYVKQDETVRLFIPTGDGASLETIMETFAGIPFDEVGSTNISTTSSSSTTTTSTSTTATP